MATDLASSWKRGRREVSATSLSSGNVARWLAWYAAQDITSITLRAPANCEGEVDQYLYYNNKHTYQYSFVISCGICSQLALFAPSCFGTGWSCRTRVAGGILV